MKTLKIELSEALAAELEELVVAGWFTSEEEIGRLALRRPLEAHPKADEPSEHQGDGEPETSNEPHDLSVTLPGN